MTEVVKAMVVMALSEYQMTEVVKVVNNHLTNTIGKVQMNYPQRKNVSLRKTLMKPCDKVR